MRSDLNKQLCEQARQGSWDKFTNYRHLADFKPDTSYDDEEREYDSPALGSGIRESMKTRYNSSHYGGKNFSENFAPLWGVIRKNVNRPWDKVYGELCKVFDKRSVINQHILIHLFSFVETKTYIQDGVVMIRSNYGSHHDLDGSTEYYVHPKTGILLKNKQYRSYKRSLLARNAQLKREQLKHTIMVTNTVTLRKIGGVWFSIEFVYTPPSSIYVERLSRRDRHSTTRPTHTHMVEEQVKQTVASELKRTLSKKELLFYGIAND